MPVGKANLGANFYPKLVQISSEVGMKPEDLLAVMVSESGLNNTAYESKYKGAGLVGFMPSTLKGMGFKGNYKDFADLSGEQQLDWLKKLVQGYSATNGGPLTSAGLYYVANLWPIALKLPGVKHGDVNTPILELNPQRGGPNDQYSKKYYDLGYKITAEQESGAYKANPLFDKEKKGAITYGDMIKQTEVNKQSPIYQKALADMRESSGYSPGQEEPTNMVATKDDFMKRYLTDQKGKENDIYDQLGRPEVPGRPQAPSNDLTSTLNKYLQQVVASEKANRRLYKQFLPINHLVIEAKAEQVADAVEFARILCAVLKEEVMAESFTHTDGQSVEVECAIHGPDATCFEAVKQLTASVVEAFRKATVKIGGISIQTQFFMNKKSSYQQISYKFANTQHRKFLLKFV